METEASILTVDDSVSMRQMLACTLKDAGYEVTEAVDGLDALEKINQRTFDLVLSDIYMPRMDGLKLLEKLRGLVNYKTTPILMLTTESSNEIKVQGRAKGATGWLIKPFDPNRLQEIVKKIILSRYDYQST